MEPKSTQQGPILKSQARTPKGKLCLGKNRSWKDIDEFNVYLEDTWGNPSRARMNPDALSDRTVHLRTGHIKNNQKLAEGDRGLDRFCTPW